MERRVISLGFFDGVHLGHGALLNAACARARASGLRSAALLFQNHPSQVLGKASVPLINTPEERAFFMREQYHIDEVLTLPFDEAMARMPWDVFVREILQDTYHACHVVAGYDYRFGHRGEGNAQRLSQLCATLGIGCDIIHCVVLDGKVISSSLIRDLISAGDMTRAAHFLGHFHRMTAKVVHGRALGRTLGVPTINQRFSPLAVLPRSGVYVTRVHIDGTVYRGVTNVGTHPTVDEERAITAETHILGFDGDLYDKAVTLEFLFFLRPERRFESVEALRAEIAKNIRFAQHYEL